MNKAIFFDIDGTLITFSGIIPESTIKALKSAKSNGHKLFICTGRSRNQIPVQLRQIDFDGYVCASGAYVECDKKEIFHNFMTRQELDIIYSYFSENKSICRYQTKDYTLMNEDNVERFLDSFYKANKLNPEWFEIFQKSTRTFWSSPMEYNNIEKVVYHECPVSIEKVIADIGKYFDITMTSFEKPNGSSGEITPYGINKSLGMKKALSYYNISRENSISFGDGPNDIEMIKYSGTGVAMGNSIDIVKAHADLITDTVDNDGIYKGLYELSCL